MKSLLLFIGTRPEAIKLAPVHAALGAWPQEFRTHICVSGQHRQMLDQTLNCLGLGADSDLNVMREQQTPAATAAAILSGAQRQIEQHQPDLILVQGDTTTALAAALAGFYNRVPIAHVEAGLRSGRRDAPWPEEVNRILISDLAELHFAPTNESAAALQQQQVAGAIHVVGNTVIDALLQTTQRLREDARLRDDTTRTLATLGYRLNPQRRLLLVTGHRRESFGAGLDNICRALAQLACAHPELDIVYAVHLNPQVRDPVHARLASLDNVFLLPPLDYTAFVQLMAHCHFILSDSGGIQEEAPSVDKPLLILREHTERPEVIACGAGRLVGTDSAAIVAATEELLGDPAQYRRMAQAPNPYGDGTTAKRIVAILRQWQP